MQRHFERLERSLAWQLLAPDRDRVPGSMACISSPLHGRLLQEVQASRVQTFGVDDRIEGEDESRSTDSAAWHFVARDSQDQVAGAMRLFVIDRRREPLQPPDVLRFGHVEFPSPVVEASHLAALSRLFERKAREPYYIYAGGFFTVEKWRGSGLAGVLGMAAIAMARLHACNFAASFVSARDRAPELFALLGGKPLHSECGSALAPFHCSRHGFVLQLMAFDSLKPASKIESGLELMTDRLRRTTVIAPWHSLRGMSS